MSLEDFFSTNIIVPIIVAFIGFLIAVTTAVIAKEQKVSEFRQAWIDALRNDMAEFYSVNYQYMALMKTFTFPTSRASYSDIQINLEKYDELLARVTLRLNWVEHENIISKIKDISEYRLSVDVGSETENWQGLETLLDSFLQLSKDILDHEWKVVKKGEPLFLKFKYISKFSAFAFLVAMYVLFSIATLQSEIFQW